jgi:hypothetical protein
MPGDAALPMGGVSTMLGAVPSGVTTDRGCGRGDGDDDPMRERRIGFFGVACGFSQPASGAGARSLPPPSSRMIE